MKKILLLVSLFFTFAFSDVPSSQISNFPAIAGCDTYLYFKETSDSTVVTPSDKRLYGTLPPDTELFFYSSGSPATLVKQINFRITRTVYGNDYYTYDLVTHYGYATCFSCPSGYEPVSIASCPPSLPDPISCKLPCPEGQTRNDAGGCCPDGLGVFCDVNSAIGWSGCQCPEGSDMIQNPNGSFSCPVSCPEGYERGADTECHAICGLCANAQQEAETICTNANTSLLDYNCTADNACLNRVFGVNCGDLPSCNECSNRIDTRRSECSALGAYLDNTFQCSEDLDTCEVTSYNAGQCIDDDQNPLDPNYGDGSQNNNDNTDDIPDTNNSASGNQDPTTGDFNIEFPDYNPAYEKIGDNIEDQTKATNAQTRANKQNTEFLGGKLDKIEENTRPIKDINDKLSFDETKLQNTFDTDEADQFDEVSFTDTIKNKLNELVDSSKVELDIVWDNIATSFNDKVFISSGTCQQIPEISASIHGKNITIFSQSIIDNTGLANILKPIVIFLFTLSGLLYIFRDM